jgi:hypothetical protein
MVRKCSGPGVANGMPRMASPPEMSGRTLGKLTLVTGHRRFGDMRSALTWRQALSKVQFQHAGRRQAQPEAWGRGYPRTVAEVRMAA